MPGVTASIPIVAFLISLRLAILPALVEGKRFEFTQVHMGMPVRVVLYARDRPAAESAARAAFARVAALDAILSDYRPDSELNRLSASSSRWVPVSPDLYAVLSSAIEIARASDGAFDPTVGPLTTLWREARRSKTLPSPSAVDDARRRVSWRFVNLDATSRAVRLTSAGVRLDLGGIAKGYVLQEALAALVQQGTPAALLEAGGDLVVGDAPPGREGWEIDAPYADAAFQRRARSLVRAALSSSGPTFQFVEIAGVRYSHVIDPRSGRPITSPRVVGVIAGDGATADGLATALGVLGEGHASVLVKKFKGAMISTGAGGRGTDAGGRGTGAGGRGTGAGGHGTGAGGRGADAGGRGA